MAKTEVEMLEEIKSGLDENSKEFKAIKAAQEVAVKQAEDITEKVKELEKKGGTIEDMQNEIKELKAKSGRMKGQSQAPTSVQQLISDTIV